MNSSPDSGKQRVAILASPRSGNTWLRHMLKSACNLQDFAVNNPDEFDWTNAPANCVVAMHWHPTKQVLDVITQEHYKVVTIFRHPLDTLISILQFTFKQPTHQWLEGEGGSEDCIFGSMPRSETFLSYAKSRRAATLLAVTPEWAQIPGVYPVSYEALVQDTSAEMNRLLATLGLVACRPLDLVIGENTIAETTTPEHHLFFHNWQGKPDNWKKLLTADVATAIAHCLESSFSAGGYRCDPDSSLTPFQADANWVTLSGANVVETVRKARIYKIQIEEYKSKLAYFESECANLKEAILRESRGMRRVKGLFRSVANFFVPIEDGSVADRAA